MIRRTLMQRDQELVDFEFDLATGEARVLDASTEGDELLAYLWPVEIDRDKALGNLVKARAISPLRKDKGEILAAQGAKSGAELALRGHGSSLSDQYWYRAPGQTERWKDVNFFENEWDPGFGQAVLSGDYARLATCSPDVPDATTPGHALKTWERNGDGTFLVKTANKPDGSDLMGAKLASEMCALLFGEGRYVPLDIVERCGRPCSIGPLMLAADEELANGSRLCAMAGIQEGYKEGGGVSEEICNARIGAYEAIGISDASAHVARMACFSCLTLLADFHEGNFGAIRKVGTDAWRPAPIFDYDGAFGFPFGEHQIPDLCARPALTVLYCAQTFSFLDPSWDWSWYDARALTGFEERFAEAYAPYRNLPSNFAELVTHLFVEQRNYVNEVASGGWK